MAKNINKRRLIDGREALDLIDKAIVERGADWVYPKYDFDDLCVYFAEMEYMVEEPEKATQYQNLQKQGFVEGAPACLVGLALSYIGLNRINIEYRNDAGVEDFLFREFDGVDWVLTEEAVNVFGVAQSQQDLGHTWGDARASAARILTEKEEE